MSGDRNRFSRSRSPKPRWHEESSSASSVVAQSSAENVTAETATASSSIATEVAVTEEPAKEDVLNKSLDTSIAENVTTAAAAAVAQSGHTAPTSDADTPKVQQRKRKWLSNDATAANLLSSKKVLTISTDTLKNYLPNVPAPSPTKETAADTNENVVSKHTDVEDSSSNPSMAEDNNSQGSTGNNNSNANKRKVIEHSNTNTSNDEQTDETLAQVQTIRQQTSRTVILEVDYLSRIYYIELIFFQKS